MPASLTKAERSLFVELIASVDPRHFVASDTLLIVSYIQAAMLAKSLAREPGKIKEWEMAVRAQVALATKLRLTPHGRLDAKTVARRAPYEGPRPWLKEEEGNNAQDDTR